MGRRATAKKGERKREREKKKTQANSGGEKEKHAGFSWAGRGEEEVGGCSPGDRELLSSTRGFRSQSGAALRKKCAGSRNS